MKNDPYVRKAAEAFKIHPWFVTKALRLAVKRSSYIAAYGGEALSLDAQMLRGEIAVARLKTRRKKRHERKRPCT